MKVGDIIRRKTVGGYPIGPYMRIEYIERNRIYASTIGLDNPNIVIARDRVYEHKIRSLCISEELLERLKNGTTICAQHVCIPKWEDFFYNPTPLVRFYTQPKGYESVFVTENVRKMRSLGEMVIKIIVGERII